MGKEDTTFRYSTRINGKMVSFEFGIKPDSGLANLFEDRPCSQFFAEVARSGQPHIGHLPCASPKCGYVELNEEQYGEFAECVDNEDFVTAQGTRLSRLVRQEMKNLRKSGDFKTGHTVRYELLEHTLSDREIVPPVNMRTKEPALAAYAGSAPSKN